MNRLVYFCLILFMFGCQKSEPRRAVERSGDQDWKKSIAWNKKMIAAHIESIEAQLNLDSTKVYSPNEFGFWDYQIYKDSSQSSYPELGDEIKYLYNVSNLEGKVIYSTTEIDTISALYGKEDQISGIIESLSTMTLGEEKAVVLPYYKAYGLTGDGRKIGMNQGLKINIKLIEINKK
ncbi:FKBP-type peptidyl-prolyl cis-trans isomerase [Flavobacteriaceae bacterium]|nr:FKBP-type peptidyl-prolyl cis-trans isomerase [Flavobacteriaceae bacterium]